jgi:hypothetical protein
MPEVLVSKHGKGWKCWKLEAQTLRVVSWSWACAGWRAGVRSKNQVDAGLAAVDMAVVQMQMQLTAMRSLWLADDAGGMRILVPKDDEQGVQLSRPSSYPTADRFAHHFEPRRSIRNLCTMRDLVWDLT